jgi:signal transduction histidine kinase
VTRLKRLSERDWRLLDRVLAGGMFVVMALDLAFGRWKGPLPVELLIAAVVATALVWRRQRPLLSAAVVIAGAVTLLLAFTSPSQADAVTIATLFASYSTGAHLDLRRALVAVVLIIAAIATVCVVKSPTDIFFPVVFFGAVPWTVGRVVRNQTALARELTEKAERQQIAREEEEARATAAERTRVARELHDVLAHNLSVMVIQASAARRVADRDENAALEAAQLISRTGREALSELRYVFGPVRKRDGDSLGASPGLTNLEQLASRAHRAGVPVEIRVEGEPFKLSPGADMAAYRVVQEGLTNVLKHAHGSRATVTVRYGRSDVELEIVDDGSDPAVGNGSIEVSGGHGLIGMRERIALYGGKLEVGEREEGGYAVRVWLPVGGAVV